MIGTQLKHYKITGIIGEGGMGTIYQSIDTRTQEAVAIKALKDELVQSPKIIKRFIHEGEALRQLNHPNIITLRETFEHEGSYYLVMEYIEGGDLRKVMDKENQLSLKYTLQIALDLADALTRTHRLDIIHRDLKPENVLLANDGIPRLTDFGIAHVNKADNLTENGIILGTLSYLSPEACLDDTVDERSDIWSFGVLLFEMLAGEKPFPGKSFPTILHAVMQNEPLDLQELRPSLPNELVDLIYRMLVKDPEGRIPSIRLVGAELEAILKGYDLTPIPSPNAFQPTERQPSTFHSPTPDSFPINHNLKIPATPFIGRQEELAFLNSLIKDPDVRLITILGPGGMGKSRLAIQTGLTQIDQFSNGVFIVELAPLNDPVNIPSIIAQTVNFPFQEGIDQKEQIIKYFSNKEMLIIMDNFEHLIVGAGLISEILSTAPGVKVLATSREKLNLSTENILTVKGMESPDYDSLEDIISYDSVKLFIQCATRNKVDFKVEDDNLIHISQICRMADGIPLGILLATAWVDVLSLQEIVEEMNSSVDFLATKSADTPDRHHSMRSVFNYSWKLLTDEEKHAYIRMSVFHGGCTRQVAQTVSNASIRILTKLVNKSVLQRDVKSGRFSSHELLRQFAQEKLEESGEEEDVRNMHSKYYLDFIAKREQGLKGKRQLEALNELDSDFENIRAAWLQAVETGDEEHINNSLEGLYLMTRYRSKFADGYNLFSKAREKWPAGKNSSNLSGRLLVRFYPLNETPEEIFKQALEIAQQHESQPDIIYAQNQLGRIAAHSFTDEGLKKGLHILEECLAAYQKLGDDFSASRVMDDISFSYTFLDQEKKIRYGKQSAELRRKINDQIGLSNALLNLSTGYMTFGDIEKTMTCNREGLEISRLMGNRLNIAWHAIFLSEMERLIGIQENDDKLSKELAAIVDEINADDLTIEYKLSQAVQLAVFDERYEEAEQLLTQAQALPSETNMHIGSFTTTGSIITVGLGKENVFFNEYIPTLYQTLQQAGESFYIYVRVIPPISAMLIKQEELQLAAACIGKLGKVTKNLGLLKFENCFPMLKKIINQLKDNLGERDYQAGLELCDSVSLLELVEKLMVE